MRSIAQQHVDGTTYWTGGQANISVVAALRDCCVSDCFNTQGAFDVGPAADKRHQPLQEGAIAEYHGRHTMQCSTITLEIAPRASITGHRNGNLCGSPCGEKGDEGFQLDIVGLSKQWVVK